MSEQAYEINFDGLVGPTHNYAGLAHGNVASRANRGKISNPKQAALQGLAKMKMMADLGLKQAILPPHERPDTAALRRLGFSGSDTLVLDKAARQAPLILAACCSASAMWAANAATVSPSADTADGRVHFTAANLSSQLHRSLEAQTTARVLGSIFSDPSFFVHHDPLPFPDEGAANHMRLCASHGDRGLEIFVHGRSALSAAPGGTKKFPARQTLEASQAIARLHGLDGRAIHLRQTPAAIDRGVFHNDVVAVANKNVLLHHADAWDGSIHGIPRSLDLVKIEVKSRQVSLADAIRSYLFNSQLVTLPDGSMALIAPDECRRIPSTRRFLNELPSRHTPIRAVHYIQVRQSMRNGGGPACLRLRVVLTERELSAAHPGVFWTPRLHEQLTAWVSRHYRDHLSVRDLSDPTLLEESRRALDELTGLLGLGSIYPFQQKA